MVVAATLSEKGFEVSSHGLVENRLLGLVAMVLSLLDGACGLHAQAQEQRAGQGRSRLPKPSFRRHLIELFRLPQYSPEFMPMEGVWKTTRKLTG